jgi:23S rRNA (guanosine2251-2'-O)-methyltransferase
VIVSGIHSVREALRTGRVERLLVGSREDARLAALVAEAEARQVAVVRLARADLERRCGPHHQGVAAEVRDRAAWSVERLVAEARGVPLLVVLDGVEDPQNVGAVLRSCDAAGADGVIRQTRRAAPLAAAASRASAGALAHVRVADVVNISRALSELARLGVWTIGLAADAPLAYDQADLTLPTALVLGAEGRGLRRLVRASCDSLVRIPMWGHVESLNASVAAGVVLFEARRQRDRRQA